MVALFSSECESVRRASGHKLVYVCQRRLWVETVLICPVSLSLRPLAAKCLSDLQCVGCQPFQLRTRDVSPTRSSAILLSFSVVDCAAPSTGDSQYLQQANAEHTLPADLCVDVVTLLSGVQFHMADMAWAQVFGRLHGSRTVLRSFEGPAPCRADDGTGAHARQVWLASRSAGVAEAQRSGSGWVPLCWSFGGRAGCLAGWPGVGARGRSGCAGGQRERTSH